MPERGLQVQQMRKIYQRAAGVLLWIGPDLQETGQATVAMNSVMVVSDFLCRKLGISISDPGSLGSTYQEYVIKKRDILPLPNECEFSDEALWNSLRWFYSHLYFSRIWVIQEISANKNRSVHCGNASTEWDRVDLVASYIIMDPTFATNYGFSSTYCWWAASVTEIVRQPRKWLSMLYLASSFSCLDARDVIYGLRGFMELVAGAELLKPDYSKSVVDVYRDSVEAALVDFQSTDALLYIVGDEDPSWVPRWDRPMWFRNPFRFGKPVPWKPAGDTKPVWSIDRKANILTLSGSIIDTVEFVEPYNESYFGDKTIESEDTKDHLKRAWQRILGTMENIQTRLPFSSDTLTAAATSFSFGLDESTNPAETHRLLQNFVAYLKLVLDKEVFEKYIPSDLAKDGEHGNAHLFGKPVWDFTYPESNLFITKSQLLGCCVSGIRPGDVLFVALGSTYPFILRPDGDGFSLRGYCYVHGLMHGGQQPVGTSDVRIR